MDLKFLVNQNGIRVDKGEINVSIWKAKRETEVETQMVTFSTAVPQPQYWLQVTQQRVTRRESWIRICLIRGDAGLST